jgi:hypothetical protein
MTDRVRGRTTTKPQQTPFSLFATFSTQQSTKQQPVVGETLQQLDIEIPQQSTQTSLRFFPGQPVSEVSGNNNSPPMFHDNNHDASSSSSGWGVKVAIAFLVIFCAGIITLIVLQSRGVVHQSHNGRDRKSVV